MTTSPAPDTPAARAVARVDKPWGHEEIFAAVEGGYVGKILYVRAGHALSLQYHATKDETVAVQSGRILVEMGPDPDRLARIELGAGQTLRVQPGLVHRMTGLSDAIVLEASTADPGWREDVVRIEDRYGRTGTVRP